MANLQPMRYKNYVWPHNPSHFTISYQRRMVAQEMPYGGYVLQNLGQSCRVMRGSGEFVGAGAYEEFKRLASVYYSAGAGTLVHPCWQGASVYFVKLTLSQEPRKDFVAYTFEFWEDSSAYTAAQKTGSTLSSASGSTAAGSGSTKVYHTVKKGETLWGIAQSRSTTVEQLLALNGQIKNPNLIFAGQKVRVA